MAVLDYSNGTHIELPRDSSIPIKTVSSSRLVPVSKISRYDQPIVLANEYFIAYPTSKQGVIRVIAQEDASHVTLSTGSNNTIIKDVSMTQLKGQGKTYLAAIVASVDNGKTSIWTWELLNEGNLSKSASAVPTHEYFPEFHKQYIVKKIQFISGTNMLLASYDSDGSNDSSFINQYMVEPKISTYIPIHQVLYSPAVDFTYVPARESIVILTADGGLHDCKPPTKGGLQKISLPFNLTRPKALVGENIVMFDKRLGVIDFDGDGSNNVGFKCTLNLTNILGDNHKLVQYNSQVAIIVDVSQNQLLVLRISNNIFKDLSIFKLGIDILDVSVTRNLEDSPGVLFDSYIFHAKGLAILQVASSELDSKKSDGVVFRSKKRNSNNNSSSGGNSPPSSKTNKQPQQKLPDDSNLEQIVQLASERLIQSGKFVSKEQLDHVKAEHQKWVNEASTKFEKLLNRFEKLMDEGNLSRTGAPSPLSIPGGQSGATRVASDSMWQPSGIRKDSPLSQEATTSGFPPSAHHRHDSIWSERQPSFQSGLWNQQQQQPMEGSWSSIGSIGRHPSQQQDLELEQEKQVQSHLIPTLSDSSSEPEEEDRALKTHFVQQEDDSFRQHEFDEEEEEEEEALREQEEEDEADGGQEILRQLNGNNTELEEQDEFKKQSLQFEDIVRKMTEATSVTTILKLLNKLDSEYEPDTLFMNTGAKRDKKREQIVILSAIASISQLFTQQPVSNQQQKLTAMDWMFNLLQLIKANDIYHQATLAVETLNKVKNDMSNEPEAKRIRDKIEYLVKVI